MMTPEKQQLLIAKGMISELPEAEQDKVGAAYLEIRRIIDEAGEAAGSLAFTLVAAQCLVETAEMEAAKRTQNLKEACAKRTKDWVKHGL